VKKPAFLGVPAEKEAEGLFYPATHLEAYQIMLARTDPK